MKKYRIKGRTDDIVILAFNASVSPNGDLMMMDDKGHYILVVACGFWTECKALEEEPHA